MPKRKKKLSIFRETLQDYYKAVTQNPMPPRGASDPSPGGLLSWPSNCRCMNMPKQFCKNTNKWGFSTDIRGLVFLSEGAPVDDLLDVERAEHRRMSKSQNQQIKGGEKEGKSEGKREKKTET